MTKTSATPEEQQAAYKAWLDRQDARLPEMTTAELDAFEARVRRESDRFQAELDRRAALPKS